MKLDFRKHRGFVVFTGTPRIKITGIPGWLVEVPVIRSSGAALYPVFVHRPVIATVRRRERTVYHMPGSGWTATDPNCGGRLLAFDCETRAETVQKVVNRLETVPPADYASALLRFAAANADARMETVTLESVMKETTDERVRNS